MAEARHLGEHTFYVPIQQLGSLGLEAQIIVRAGRIIIEYLMAVLE